MANKGTGIDIWERTALVARGRRKGVTFQLLGFERIAVASGRLSGLREPLASTVVGLTGRDLILKYSRVPEVPDWQLAKLMAFEVDEIAEQAGGALSSDYNLLPIGNEMTGEDTVLLALAKNDALDASQRLVESGKGQVAAFTPNAIALYNAYLMLGQVTEDDTILLAWLGERTLDIALVRGPNLLFARNVSGGLAVLDGAIAQQFNVREERAEKIRREHLNLDPKARGKYSSSQEERVSHSVQAVSGQLQAALRSTVAFCQSQTSIQDLQVKRALVCGPGARVVGVADFLREGLGCPVECWDPAPDVDVSACPGDQQEALLDAGSEATLALGLAMAPCFDDLYSIEILPESVKRKRRFLSRTIWTIAAAVLALAYLGWHALDAKKRHDALAKTARLAKVQVDRVKKTHSRTKRVVESNADNAARLVELQRLAVPLFGTIRVLRAVRATLPQDLWLTKLSSEISAAPWVRETSVPKKDSKDTTPTRRARKTAKRPVVHVFGRGIAITDRSLQDTFGRFKSALEAHGVPVRAARAGTTNGFTFDFKVDYLDVAQPEN